MNLKDRTEGKSFLTPRGLITYPTELPISSVKDEIVAALRAHQVVIIAGETGSGKTTQIPKMCLEAGLGTRATIGCTQPRRIAALSVSRRIAEELKVTWGQEVGCKIRFSDHTASSTAIKVMTDGILLAETASDPLLRAYEALIIDEAHERSLNIDFLLGYLRRLLPRRPDLKLIITSATIDTQLFSKAFNDAPVFEVSGRLYPVEVRYRPLEADPQEGEISYVEGAVRAVLDLCAGSSDGDILVFMPSERDIRDVLERLKEANRAEVELLPLMGSLSSHEQERVFHSTDKRKVIVSTNIAETSLTIPKIRFVIDSGLARISRFNPRTRTKRLPIEAVAKSSVLQRTGRAGRVRDGICIRLFSEEDFESRPDFTDPEIVRANLAEVILRMKSLKLGEVAEFPFIVAPDSRAIRSGYALLQELGALDTANALTQLGRELAALPVDPVIGRMLLQSRREDSLPELLVIAAALSIQDPRERPVAKRDKADRAHQAFKHPDSDFLTFLRIWSRYRDVQRATQGQGAIRRFCKEHFLSYLRMREWSDVHGELARAMNSKPSSDLTDIDTIQRFDGRYRGIHRAILAGLLGQIAYRCEKNLYQAGAGRQLFIAPGSSLRETARTRTSQSRGSTRRDRPPSQEQWIVASEIIETSHIFARTCARIIPSWIEELGKHLVKRSAENPHWNESRGCVTALERVKVSGLVVSHRQVPFARIDPDAAKEIFIRSVCVNEDSPLEYECIRANRQLCDKVAARLAHAGRLNTHALEESLVTFYMQRLPSLASLKDLDHFIRHEILREPARLTATLHDLWCGTELGSDEAQFPDRLEIGGATVHVRYRYSPGTDRDGVTLSIPLGLAKRLPPKVLDGAIPGLREQQILFLIRELPKRYRLALDNFPETARLAAADDTFQRLPLHEALCHVLKSRFGIAVPLEILAHAELPVHLKPRIEVLDPHTTMDTAPISDPSHEQSDIADKKKLPHAWESARTTWEREKITAWDFGDLPSSIEVARVSGVPVYLYPALVPEEQTVSLRLLDTVIEAQQISKAGTDLLLRRALSKELYEISKQSRGVDHFKPLITLFTTPERLRESTFEAAVRHLFTRESTFPLLERDFHKASETARQRIPNLVPSLLSIIGTCLQLRRQVLDTKRPYPGMREDLKDLLPADFLERTPFEHLKHLPRYLKALLIRAERADLNPSRDKQRAEQIRPYLELVRNAPSKIPPDFRWMVEEFRVSLFAQELGTAYPISAARLDKACAQAQSD